MNNKAQIFKYIALGAAGMYIYQQFKDNPHSLGSHDEVRLKAHRLIDHLSRKSNMHPGLNGLAKHVANEMIDDKMKIRDVTPKRNSQD